MIGGGGGGWLESLQQMGKFQKDIGREEGNKHQKKRWKFINIKLLGRGDIGVIL